MRQKVSQISNPELVDMDAQCERFQCGPLTIVGASYIRAAISSWVSGCINCQNEHYLSGPIYFNCDFHGPSFRAMSGSRTQFCGGYDATTVCEKM
jgi:hypothetical protein